MSRVNVYYCYNFPHFQWHQENTILMYFYGYTKAVFTITLMKMALLDAIKAWDIIAIKQN